MRILRVYLDTSVVSYLYQLDTPEKMKDTLELWELFRQGHYQVYISDIVLNEISGCSHDALPILTASISRQRSWQDVILLHPGTLNIS